MSQTTAAASPANIGATRADIKLIVLDIDGTIAGTSNQISNPVKLAIKAAQAKGVQVAIATGRMYRSALRFHQEIGSVLPLIAYQGALIKDPLGGKVHQHLPVCQHIALQLLDYFEQPALRQALSVHCYIDDQLYVREMKPETRAYGDRTGVEPVPLGDLRPLVSTNAPTKVLALCQDPTVIDQLLTVFRLRYTPAELYLTTSYPTFFEATNPAVNKGAAVRYLAEDILGLQPTNVMTVGDNFNDLEMISYAGVGVAMGNAPLEVRTAANWVAPSVDRNGAAAAIQQFVL